jgi:hypothetical protein
VHKRQTVLDELREDACTQLLNFDQILPRGLSDAQIQRISGHESKKALEI